MKIVKISTEFIKLGQLLKLAGIADSGAYAKILIINGDVKLNGVVEKQRGKKIYKGDTIEIDNIKYNVK